MQRVRQLAIAAILLVNAALLMVTLLRYTGGSYRIPAIHIDLDTIPTVGELFKGHLKGHGGRKGHPVYKPDPDWLPPIIKDPSELLLSHDGTPPAIPSYNTPEPELWRKHGLEVAPPLLIGFTRSWPILIQAVVSYITAGWPPEMIYVVENTGVQQANARGQLTLQNPFFCNHTMLKALGVNILTTPALLTFAQLQNYYLSLTYQHKWPYYFWSHMDVLVLGHEEGLPDVSPKATEEGYKSMYTLAIEELGRTMAAEKEWRAGRGDREQKTADRLKELKNSHDGGNWERQQRRANADGDDNEEQHEGKWATRFFAYDLLTLMNPRAVEDVGGWDSMISYYYTDCDFYSRLWMRGWGNKDVNVGIVRDVSTVLDDLRALYRVPGVKATWTDPNPPPPGQIGKRGAGRHWQAVNIGERTGDDDEEPGEEGQAESAKRGGETDPQEDWRRLRDVSSRMLSYKQASHNNRARGRNTWQLGQHGYVFRFLSSSVHASIRDPMLTTPYTRCRGQGEPFFYDMTGIQESIDVMTEAGKEVYRRKWAKTDCYLIDNGRLGFHDQWKVSRIQYD